MAFETRIQSNWRKKSRNRTRWLRAVYCLAALMAYCVYSLMSAESSLSTTQNMTPSSEKAEDQASWHGWTLTLLVSLLLSAFASGILSSRLSAPSDFLSRANRSCAPYQVSFSTASGKAGGVLGFSRRIPSAFASGFYEYKRRILSHGYRAGPSIVIKETEEGEEE